ncbi:MAG: hypothetical protein PUG60_15130 [Lachnospiraceae bacterium]|nr:hypothetical protein [Lachnospiraceae bacterium]
MKFFKKLTAGLLTLAACASMSMAAFAEEGTTSLNLFVPNDPTYTITIPASVDLSATEPTDIPVTASDVNYIPDGKKISVTFVKGTGTYGRLYMTADNPNGGKQLLHTLYIKGTEDEWKSGALEKQIKGMELASFTEDGVENFQIKPAALVFPDSTNDNLRIIKGAKYTETMTYGIGLTDIQ